MNTAFKAIETTGKLKDRNHIILDEPLPLEGNRNINEKLRELFVL